jgi:hypothetical protein
MIASLHQRARAVVAFAKRRLQMASDYQAVYNSAEGQRVLRDILREGGILEVAHVAGDPGTSQFNDGKRALALYVVERLRWNEGELVALAQTQTSDQLDMEE